MNEIQTTEEAKPVSALAAMSNRLQVSEAGLMKTLKATVFKACKSDEEFMALVMVSNEYKLNPIIKEIYAFPGKGGGVVPMVSVDGWLKLMNRQPTFDGLTVKLSQDGEEATATIHIKGRSHPVEVTEYLSECSRPTDPWKKSPKRMLRHKATIQAIRVAFGIGGIHDEDEAKDYADAAPKVRDITPQAKIEPFKEVKQIEEPKPEVKEPKQEEPQEEAKAFEVTIAKYELKEGIAKGKPWKLHVLTLTDGEKEVEANTFSNTIGGLAEFNVGGQALVTLEKTPKGLGILTLEILTGDAK